MNIKEILNNNKLILMIKNCYYQLSKTKEQLQQEIEFNICKNNIKYFLETYCKIITLEKGLSNFKLKDYQNDILDLIMNNNKIFILKSRQIGFSTLIALYLVYKIIFDSNKTIAIITSNVSQSKEILSTVYEIYDSLPEFIKNDTTLKNRNRENCITNNNLKIITGGIKDSFLRGISVHELILDEFSFVSSDILDDFFKTYVPIIMSNNKSKIIIGTSLNKDNDYFMELLEDVKTNKEFSFIDVNVDNYHLHTEEQECYHRSVLGNKRYEQEFLNK